MIESNKFETAVKNVEQISDKQFSIPAYQRPYVWGQIEIDKLITDFYRSFKSDENQSYFIGSILTKERDLCEELIDGQQRFTTLWLMAFVFKKMDIETEFLNFLEITEGKLRISFEIRNEVELYLTQLLGHDSDALEITSFEIDNLPYLKNIAKALATIENIIQQLEKDKLLEFGNYIYRNIFFVKNCTANNVDLNNLFATINSSGVQLEQTDIVKSNLLRIIGDDKVLYSKIWETCENMNNFFERNAKTVFNASSWNSIDLSNYVAFNHQIFKYKKNEESDGEANSFSIRSILEKNTGRYNPTEDASEKEMVRESEDVYCRSILNFGQLLLHVYRLHLKTEGLSDFIGTFHVHRLIEIFNEMEKRNDKEEVARFFKLLWDVRYLFDKFVIKWISDLDEKTEHLELVNINRNAESNYSRTNYEKSKALMLQSVLYFTGDYFRQFWLTPFLGYLLKNKNIGPTSNELLKTLEKIDNQLSLCSNLPDKEASYKIMDVDLDASFDVIDYLSKESIGTSFKHYWFQKLEYILWKNWQERNDLKFKVYRITSRNSIEHIYPQHPKISPTLPPNILNNFGNLVLLSVSQNSEYSNKEVNVKQREFENKQKTYDTLKSFFIFQNENWDDKTIIKHKEDMIDRIKVHYNL